MVLVGAAYLDPKVHDFANVGMYLELAFGHAVVVASFESGSFERSFLCIPLSVYLSI